VTAPSCPACGGPGGLLGTLGFLRWFRCIACGMEFNRRLRPRRRKAEKAPQARGEALHRP
jgi:hypothetical protein